MSAHTDLLAASRPQLGSSSWTTCSGLTS